MRLVILSLLLACASAPAFAHDDPVTKDELKELKGRWLDEKGQFKDIEKIAKQWTAAAAKDNQDKMHAIDVKLLEWRRGVLEDLREDGVSTREVGVDTGAPAQQRLRDLVVELRDNQVRFDDETAPKAAYKHKSELLSLIVAEMSARVDRYEKRYENHKDRYKAQK
ncbi:MAG TPA: hypothetical protein PKA64_03505 [Myxococcota bacterium]|nr:hypothetical protein [Myxococcota bacterium]